MNDRKMKRKIVRCIAAMLFIAFNLIIAVFFFFGTPIKTAVTKEVYAYQPEIHLYEEVQIGESSIPGGAIFEEDGRMYVYGLRRCGKELAGFYRVEKVQVIVLLSDDLYRDISDVSEYVAVVAVPHEVYDGQIVRINWGSV